MVEVVTMEEFDEFRQSIARMRVEDQLAALNEKIDALIEESLGKYATKADIDEALTEVKSHITRVEASSKGFIDRLREALRRE